MFFFLNKEEGAMGKIGEITFDGESGKEYLFHIYEWETNFAAEEISRRCVYLVSKRHQVEAGVLFGQTVLYVGETVDLYGGFDGHEKTGCFTENGANCFCIHFDDDEKSRKTKANDLIKALSPVCNG